MSEITKIVQQMRNQREEIIEILSTISKEDMTLPAKYGKLNVDIRYRFYRFIAHEVEHTLQISKTLFDLNIFPSEARQILQKMIQTRGELEGILINLEDEDLDKKPTSDQWSVRETLEHIIEVEKGYTDSITSAIEN
tara:strand:- start:9180 stop:9590 length:411 start_codon:yes stop_codon:yes gene_type:complete